jgi:hypothetical protein
MLRDRVAFGLVIVAALAAGCESGGGPTGPEGTPTGLSFTLQGGAGARQHQSSGSATTDSRGIPTFGTWAVARADSLGGLVIAGFQPVDGSSGDLFILQLSPRRTGDFACNEHGTEGCHGRTFLGVNPQALTVSGGTYVVTGGSVSITEASDSRVKGTMSLTLKNVRGPETLTITGGTIDVAYSASTTLSNGIACLARNLATGQNGQC